MAKDPGRWNHCLRNFCGCSSLDLDLIGDFIIGGTIRYRKIGTKKEGIEEKEESWLYHL